MGRPIQRRKLEALAEAVQAYSGYQIPGSALYLSRNPGGLRAFKPEHQKDEAGNRVFGSVIDGLQALLFDTALKLSGESKHKLQVADSLVEFAISHGQPPTAADAYAKFMRKAMQDESINK